MELKFKKKGVKYDFLTGDKKRDAVNIKILLLKNGITQADIARMFGITVQSVNKCINRNVNIYRVLDFINELYQNEN